MKVKDIVQSLLPLGTDGSSFQSSDNSLPFDINYTLCPVWPPDVFAVVATIIDRTGCYTQAGPDRANPGKHKKYLDKVRRLANSWSTQEKHFFYPPNEIQAMWKNLVDHFETPLSQVCKEAKLVQTLFELFAIADEACAGVGWDGFVGSNKFEEAARFNFVRHGKNFFPLKNRPFTICGLVPPDAAVVLPKTLTATVGCTIRSLSHHLALLPPKTQVKSSWALISTRPIPNETEPVNLLIVPFPFKVDEKSFTVSAEPYQIDSSANTAAFFELTQSWLQDAAGNGLTAKQIFEELLKPLIESAKNSSNPAVEVHGVLMPECALAEDLADDIAKLLPQTGIHFFVTGILTKDAKTGATRNIAKTFVIDKASADGAVQLMQNKHHRWRLDKKQCRDYGLTFHAKSASTKWWEDIDISERTLPFFAFRNDMSMAVLICEDLARNDPAMPVIRAIGPNLVLALLMDGPQLTSRWPGKSASVLADDPGSAVLSITCGAMVDRSNKVFKNANSAANPTRTIGLFRDATGNNHCLDLADNSHAILLTLRPDPQNQSTLDARPDNYRSHKLSYSSARQISVAVVPSWL